MSTVKNGYRHLFSMHRMQMLSKLFSICYYFSPTDVEPFYIDSAQFAEILDFNFEAFAHGAVVGIDSQVSDMKNLQLNIAFLRVHSRSHGKKNSFPNVLKIYKCTVVRKTSPNRIVSNKMQVRPFREVLHP